MKAMANGSAKSTIEGVTSVIDVSDRRTFLRHPVDCAILLFPVNGGVPISGRVTDLSLGGCQVVTEQRILPEMLTRIEAEFELRGIPFRVVGVVAGSRGPKKFAVRFLDLSPRLFRQLVESIAEVEEDHDLQAIGHDSANPDAS